MVNDYQSIGPPNDELLHFTANERKGHILPGKSETYKVSFRSPWKYDFFAA